MGNFFKNFLTVICSFLLALLVAEGVLRFFPVNEGLRLQPVNEDNPIAHFEPNRTSTWSRFADFSMVNTVHSNNYGFINDQDYDPHGKLPLIAVIGDSYVEAAMVPYHQTMHGRLAEELKGKYRVYSFGVSGAPLSQYLAFARFARDEFKPEKMIFVIVGNDFDESLLEYKSSPGFHYFAKSQGDKLTLTRIDFTTSLARQLLRNFKLIMYLATNVQAQHVLQAILPSDNGTSYVGQTPSEANKHRLTLSQLVIKEFLDEISQASGLPPNKILFAIDAMRPHMYSLEDNQKAQGSYFDIMRKHFIKIARKKNFKVVDLGNVFSNDYKINTHKFEYPHDGHWNGYGHKVVFKDIADRMLE